jgi:streptogramin lyase
MKSIKLLLLVFICIISCKGQNKTHSQEPKISTNKGFAGQPKIVRPKGTNPYTSIRCSLEDKDGNLWFGTTGAGVYRYDGRSFINFTEKDGLSSNTVYCMLEDKDGNIWVGTDNGVCRYNPSAAQLAERAFLRFVIPGIDDYSFINEVVDPKKTLNNVPPAKAVLSMIQDKAGNLWFGTMNSGLCRYDPSAVPGKARDAFTYFKYNDGAWRIVTRDDAKYNDGLHKNDIQCMLEDKAGNIWFSAIGHGGVYRYDLSAHTKEGGFFTHIVTEEKIQSHIFCMIEDRTGNIWFGSREDGVFCYNPSAAIRPGEKTLTYFTEKDGFCSNSITRILEDNNGNIWFGSTFKEEAGRTQGCVTRYDPLAVLKGEGKAFTHFPLEGVANTSIWNILEDKKGNIWFGSRNAGLYRYDPSSTPKAGQKIITTFTEKVEVEDGC